MAKEVVEQACFIELPVGLHGHPKYNQHFVRADKSQFPPKAPKDKANFANSEAMRVTMGR